MANIRLRKNTWYAVWYENNKQIMRTTNIKANGEKERRLAQNAADTMEQTSKGNITVSSAVDALKKIACSLGMSKKIPSVLEYFNAYKPTGSESHRKNVIKAIDMFLDYLGSNAFISLDLLSVKTCKEFFEKQLKRVSVNTVKAYKSHLQNAMQVAVEEEMISRNPFQLVCFRRLTQGLSKKVFHRQPFTMEEITCIIQKTVYPWKEMSMLCILTGGQRLGDIACLKWSQVKWDDGLIIIKTTKTGKIVATPMTKVTRELLEPLYDSHNEYVFPHCAARYIRSKGCLSSEFVTVLKTLGIVKERNMHEGAGKRISDKSFHSFRHSVVSMLRVNANFTSDLIRETVGHDSEAIERGYFTPAIEAKRTIIDYLAEKIAPTADIGEG